MTYANGDTYTGTFLQYGKSMFGSLRVNNTSPNNLRKNKDNKIVLFQHKYLQIKEKIPIESMNYDGNWRHDWRVGTCSMDHYSGLCYQGHITDNKADGKGILTHPCGLQYSFKEPKHIKPPEGITSFSWREEKSIVQYYTFTDLLGRERREKYVKKH